ncbi:hypothetical protein HSX37_06210|uniref:Uncharacterized protein n=1 Tax=Dendrosporobacter quercicolus TaxID=146817 RepID=A0A1G9YEP8_9FIRM|nr:hypothetical protein [Dendrosporobacter quercicolus]NSL47633.1 hypothetical protein [Dendrosporobacter quercicolus DSM 1736]SDN07629.1 hypothetical protein SAMN04488502_11181 [Dendrosporobacter quercicolus]
MEPSAKQLDNFYYQKVGASNALAIARISLAGLLELAGGSSLLDCLRLDQRCYLWP